MNQEKIQLLGAETCPYVVLHGVDTLVINVRYTDEHGKPTRALLDEQFIPLLNEWQARAKVEEKPVPIPWTFQNVSFLMHPHGAGKGQWRWLLTSSKLNLALGLGKLNGIIAQVRCSSDYLWSCEDFATVVVEVSVFLYGLFGEHIALQPQDYRCAIGLFLRYMADMHQYTAIKQVTEADVLGWLSYLRNTTSRLGRPYSSRTIETYSRDVAVFFR